MRDDRDVPEEVLAIKLPAGLEWIMFCREPAVEQVGSRRRIGVVNDTSNFAASTIHGVGWEHTYVYLDTQLEVCQALANYLWVTYEA